ncbi:MAG: transposase [Caldilineaceae bacterium SB0661_bin_34]|nr:transposase [Caldilineaceae bacterium SB0661_bin_34]
MAHSVGEFVRDMVYTNGLESFWSMLKRDYVGVYLQMFHKHLNRYVTKFAGRHNVRRQDTPTQMSDLVRGGIGTWLWYADLIANPVMTAPTRCS